MKTIDGTPRAAWLASLEMGYPLFLLVLIVGSSMALAALALRRRGPCGLPLLVARGALAGMTTLVAVLVVEGSVGVYLAWFHRLPHLAMVGAAPRPGGSGEEVTIQVIGESSAEGVPYKDWLSVGKIVTWQLRRLFPQRMFHVEIQARAGWTLEQMHQKLAESPRRPDVVILYAGHNEFASRFGWSDSVPYYHDDPRPGWPQRLTRAVAVWSPLCRWIEQAAARDRVASRPAAQRRLMVDVPSHTAAQYQELLGDFRRRLAAILADLKQAGVLTILIVPPGNDAGFEPSRSILPPETPRAARDSFTAAMEEARALEASDLPRTVQRYRELIAIQPGFAEAHFRLARLLEREAAWDEAYREYVRARDLDGHPMRCPTAFQDVYRQLAEGSDAILVDGQSVLHLRQAHGLLDDSLFNDAMHPSLEGYAALSEAVLAALKNRQAFGWPSSIPAPSIDLAECAAHFDVSTATWKAVCRFAAGFYWTTIPIRFDSSEREAKARRYEEALRQLETGALAEVVRCPGIGIRDPFVAASAVRQRIEDSEGRE
jgi:lysophospholipase L1-like esterase